MCVCKCAQPRTPRSVGQEKTQRMTWGIRDIAHVVTSTPRKGFFGTAQPLFSADWGAVRVAQNWTLEDVYKYAVGCHLNHTPEFLAALLAYCVFYVWNAAGATEYRELQPGWVGKVFAYNFACELVFYGFWHYLTYVSSFAQGLKAVKFNPQE